MKTQLNDLPIKGDRTEQEAKSVIGGRHRPATEIKPPSNSEGLQAILDW